MNRRGDVARCKELDRVRRVYAVRRHQSIYHHSTSTAEVSAHMENQRRLNLQRPEEGGKPTTISDHPPSAAEAWRPWPQRSQSGRKAWTGLSLLFWHATPWNLPHRPFAPQNLNIQPKDLPRLIHVKGRRNCFVRQVHKLYIIYILIIY